MGRDLGRLGEDTLKKWADEIGIIANRSVDNDSAGWDYLLEFPLPSNSVEGLPLDKAPFPLKCKVQVKSTDGRPGRWSIKLDNWERFVKSDEPAFFLVLEFDRMKDCQRAYLIHVGEKYIQRVLKRLRKLSLEKRVELHKVKLQFSYEVSEELNSLDGEGLKNEILKYVGYEPEEYGNNKRKIINDIGYEGGYYRLNVNIRLPNGKESLVDLFLGIIPDVKIEHGEIKDVRFGIEYPIEKIEKDSKLMMKSNTFHEGMIRFYLPYGL